MKIKLLLLAITLGVVPVVGILIICFLLLGGTEFLKKLHPKTQY